MMISNGLRNDTYNEYQIEIALKATQRSLEALQGHRRHMKHVSFMQRLWGKFREIKLFLNLRRDLRELDVLIKHTPCTSDPLLSILVGEVLYKLNAFESAAFCFNRALEILDSPDQDIRIRALVGGLETKVMYQMYQLQYGQTYPNKYQESVDLYDLIMQDLYAVNLELQPGFKIRLGRIRLQMAVIEIKIQVKAESKIYRTLS